jgi:hypothetical protein
MLLDEVFKGRQLTAGVGLSTVVTKLRNDLATGVRRCTWRG